MKTENCPKCGMICEIVGDETMHYEPLDEKELLSENAILKEDLKNLFKTFHAIDNDRDKLKLLIEKFKIICHLADVPQLIIDHPSFIKSQPLTEDDIKWAREEIKKYNHWKTAPF